MAKIVNETVSSDSKWPVPTRYSSTSRFKRDVLYPGRFSFDRFQQLEL